MKNRREIDYSKNEKRVSYFRIFTSLIMLLLVLFVTSKFLVMSKNFVGNKYRTKEYSSTCAELYTYGTEEECTLTNKDRVILDDLNLEYSLESVNSEQFISTKQELTSKSMLKRHYIWLVVVFMLAIVLINMYRTYLAQYKNYNVGQHGEDEFAEEEEIIKQYKNIPLKGEYEGIGGFPVNSIGDILLLDESPTNNLILGMSRSGKGELFIRNMIDVCSRASHKPSMVINDIKPELIGMYGLQLKERGYRVHVLNMRELEKSICFNPLDKFLDYIENGSIDKASIELISIADTLIPDGEKKDIWQGTGRSLFSTAVWLLTEEWIEGDIERDNITLYSVYTVISELKDSDKYDEDKTKLNVIMEKKKVTDNSRKSYQAINLPSGNTWASVMLTTMSAIALYCIDNVGKYASHSTLKLSDFGYGEEPIALFLVPSIASKSLNTFISLFIDQLYSTLDEMTEKTNGKMDRNVHFILDEIGSTEEIRMLPRMMSTGLSKGFRVTIAVQELQQLEKIYGKEKAKEIRSNSSNYAYVLSDDEDALEQLSKALGNKTVEEISKAGNVYSERSITTSYSEKRVMTQSDLKKLGFGEFILLRPNYRFYEGYSFIPKPIKGNMIPAHKYHDNNEVIPIDTQLISNEKMIADREKFKLLDTEKLLNVFENKYLELEEDEDDEVYQNDSEEVEKINTNNSEGSSLNEQEEDTTAYDKPLDVNEVFGSGDTEELPFESEEKRDRYIDSQAMKIRAIDKRIQNIEDFIMENKMFRAEQRDDIKNEKNRMEKLNLIVNIFAKLDQKNSGSLKKTKYKKLMKDLNEINDYIDSLE